MSAEHLQGLPGGPVVQTVTIAKQITYNELMMGDVQPLPDGGMQITFLERDGTAHVIPLNQQAAEKLGKQLLAPRVALPGNGRAA